eukprot:533788-Rhodomonas_salina.1
MAYTCPAPPPSCTIQRNTHCSSSRSGLHILAGTHSLLSQCPPPRTANAVDMPYIPLRMLLLLRLSRSLLHISCTPRTHLPACMSPLDMLRMPYHPLPCTRSDKCSLLRVDCPPAMTRHADKQHTSRSYLLPPMSNKFQPHTCRTLQIRFASCTRPLGTQHRHHRPGP